MGLTFQVIPDYGIVYARYEGIIRVEESDQAFQEYLQHPDYKPGQKQLVDLSRATDFDRDYTKIMQLQSRKADGLVGPGSLETLVVYIAPTPVTAKVARIVQKSWDGIDSMIALIAKDEEEAMVMLGLDGLSIAQLLETVKACPPHKY